MMTKTAAPNSHLKVKVSQPGPCQHRFEITLGKDAVPPVRDEIVKSFQDEAVLPGFRKGKAPREMVERKYPAEIREELVRRLTQQTVEQVAKERNLKTVGPFEVTKLNFDEAKGLSLEAQVEVEPEFKLADYRGIRLSLPEPVVAPDDVEKGLAQLREAAAQMVPTGEGDQKEKKLPELNDEFAKDVGFESLPALREHVEAKLREQQKQHQQRDLEQKLTDELITRHQFAVPPRLVAHQAERLTRDFQMRLMMSGQKEAQVKEETAKYTEQLKTNAERYVRLSFVLDRIADTEKLEITQDEVLDRLWKLSQRWGKDPAEVRKLLDKEGLWSSILSSVRQDKTTDLLLRIARGEDVSAAQQAA